MTEPHNAPEPLPMTAVRQRGAYSVVLEISRKDDVADPYAMPDRPQKYFMRQPDGGYTESVLRWTPKLHRMLAAVRVGAEAEMRQQIGRILLGFLKGFGWTIVERQIEQAIEAGQAVVITLRSAAAELWRLPWSLTLFGPGEVHIGGIQQVLLRHEWPETRTTPLAARPMRPERVLVAWAAPGRPVPWQAHVDAVAEAARLGAVPFDPEADVLAQVDAARLTETLRSVDPERPISILHLLCHGAAIGDGFGLSFASPDGPVAIDAGQIRTLLSPFADRVRLVVIAACDSGNDGPWEATLGSVAQTLHRAGFAAVVASRQPLSGAASVTFAEAFYRALLVEPSAVERACRKAIQALIETHPNQADWAGMQLWGRDADGVDTRPITFRPYRGLLPFEAEHARFFFGRTRERMEAVADLRALIREGRPRLLVVAAASGTGKSSMVRAGVLPDIISQRPGVRVAITKPGTDPLGGLERAMTGWDEQRALVLLVDQFEELFTQSDPETAREFTKRIWRLAGDPADQTAVIITLRVDFIGRCGHIVLDDGLRFDAVAYDDRHRVFIAQMSPEALREAIEGPAWRVGLTLAPGLPRRMLEDVGAEPGSLPLLQYALDQLWQRREGRVLTHAAYDAIGGVTGALTGHADRVIDRMDEATADQARRLLVELVSLGEDAERATRRRVDLAGLRPVEAAGQAAFDDATARLLDARLVFREESASGPTVEIAHEALIRKWARFQGWVDADRERLVRTREIVQLAETHLEHGTVMQGNQLGHALEVARQYPDGLPAETLEVIERSDHERQRSERRAKLYVITALVVFISSSIIMGTLGYLGYNSAQEADARRAEAEAAGAEAAKQREEALAARDRAHDASLLALAVESLTSNPAFAAAALREIDDPRSYTSAVQAYLDLSRAPIPVMTYNQAIDVPIAAFSPDSQWLATHAARDVVALARVDGQGAPRFWDGRFGAFGPQSRVLAILDPDEQGGRVRLVPVEPGDGLALTSIEVPDGVARAVSFHPEGHRVAVGTSTGAVYIRRTDGRGQTIALEHPTPIVQLRHGPLGEWLYAVGANGRVYGWHRERPDKPRVFEHQSPRMPLQFASGGTRLVTTADNGDVRIWRLDQPRRRPTLIPRPTLEQVVGRASRTLGPVLTSMSALIGPPEAAAINHDLGLVLIAGATIDAYDLEGRRLARVQSLPGCMNYTFDPTARRLMAICREGVRIHPVLRGSGGSLLLPAARRDHPIRVATFSPDGRHVATGDRRETRVWPTSDAVGVRVFAEMARFSAVALAPSGAFAIGGEDGQIRVGTTGGPDTLLTLPRGPEPVGLRRVVIDPATLMERTFSTNVGPLPSAQSTIRWLGWPPDEASVFSVDAAGVVRRHPADGARQPVTLGGPLGPRVERELSPDGRTLALGVGPTVELWPTDGERVDRAAVRRLSFDTPPVDLDFSADGRRLAVARPEAIELCTLADLSCARLPVELSDEVEVDLAFSPDGQHLAVTVDGGAALVKLDGERVRFYFAAGESIESIHFAAEGRTLIGLSNEGTISLANVETGEGELRLDPPGRVLDMSLVLGAWHLGIVSADGQVRLYDLGPKVLPRVDAATRVCLDVDTRVHRLGEDAREACEQATRCEARFGRPAPECPEHVDTGGHARISIDEASARAALADLIAEAELIRQQNEALRDRMSRMASQIATMLDDARSRIPPPQPTPQGSATPR